MAELRRSAGLEGENWYAYCTEHLYGRRVRNGVVEVSVAADSIAATRGYADDGLPEIRTWGRRKGR